MELSKHENKTLLSIYRKYSDDELWKFLIRVCQERGIEIGQLKSEIDELKHLLENQPVKIIERVVEITKVIPSKKDAVKKSFDDAILELGFDDNSIEKMQIDDVDKSELKLIKAMGQNGKHWMFGYLNECLKKRRTILNKKKKKRCDFVVEILKEQLHETVFNSLMDEANQLFNNSSV